MKSSYMTVAEMRANPELVKNLDTDPKNGDNATRSRRFEGSTSPEFVYEFISHKDDRILECGPFRGPLTKELQDKGYSNIHTLDFVDILDLPDRSRLGSVHAVDFNSEMFPHESNFFDHVICFGMVEHLENPFHFQREVARVLKPGGLFLMSIPNVFHIISRLVFLRRGMFPRWSYVNNHISLLPHGIFEKTFLLNFELLEERYTKPHLTPFLPIAIAEKVLPSNQWFGDYVTYILKKK